MVHKQTAALWDDLRVVLLLARESSVRSAARALGTSHSTVLRRLGALEAAMGSRLFDRSAEGYALTAAGQDVFDTATQVEDLIDGLERRVEGRDSRLSGRVRITLPDPLLRPLLPIFAEVGRAYPEIEMTIATTTGFLDLAHREADIALRIAEQPPADLVGRRVCKIATGVFGTERYLRGRSTSDLESLDWIGQEVDSTMIFARWIETNVPNARIALRVAEPWALRDAVDADLGVTILPCVTGDSEPAWRRVRLLTDMATSLWILTHRDLKTTARVRVVRDALWDALLRRRKLLQGELAAEPRRSEPPRRATSGRSAAKTRRSGRG